MPLKIPIRGRFEQQHSAGQGQPSEGMQGRIDLTSGHSEFGGLKLCFGEIVIQITGLVGVGHRGPHSAIEIAILLDIGRPPGAQKGTGRIQAVFAAGMACGHQERLLGLGRIDQLGICIVVGPQQHQSAEQVDPPNESSGHIQARPSVQGSTQSLQTFGEAPLQKRLSGNLEQLNRLGLGLGTRFGH